MSLFEIIHAKLNFIRKIVLFTSAQFSSVPVMMLKAVSLVIQMSYRLTLLQSYPAYMIIPAHLLENFTCIQGSFLEWILNVNLLFSVEILQYFEVHSNFFVHL